MDLWAPDATPEIAEVENDLTGAFSNYLYRVHLDAHRALGLGPVDADTVRQAYRTDHLPLAKAEEGGLYRAERLFQELKDQPARARKASDLAELLSQSWYERGLITDAAQRSVVRANVRGVIEAQRAGGRSEGTRPSADDPPGFGTLLYGQERAMAYAVRLRDTTRHTLAVSVQNALLRGDSPAQLASHFVQEFGHLNRDARRLAVTEIALARQNGFLHGAVGRRVAWFAAADCCAHCQKQDGREFLVTAGPADPDTCVWPGKHNVGVPAAERTPSLPYHPNCRCRWVIVLGAAPAGVSSATLAAIAALDES